MLNKGDFTILVVDDEEEVVAVDSTLFKMEGYKVLTTCSGVDAIEIIKNNKVDVLVLDYFMPDLTGEEVIQEIRKFNKELVILLQTGYAGQKPPKEMLEQLEIQGYHDKTDGMETLLIWVASCVRTSSLIKENKRMFEEVQLVNKTVETVLQQEEKIIQQEKMAFLGELIWVIIENLNVPVWSIKSVSLELSDQIAELVKNYYEIINQSNSSKENSEAHLKNIENIQQCIQKINSYSNKMEEVIEAYKGQISNIESKEEEITIEEILKRVQLILQKDLKLNYCKIKQDININPFIQVKSGNKLVTVINNIIKNAIQAYNGESGEIVITVSQKEDNTYIIIKDKAKGIPEDIQTKIFKEAVSTKDSLGLGLYITYTIIKGHFGGNIWFETEENEGTTFYITIPNL